MSNIIFFFAIITLMHHYGYIMGTFLFKKIIFDESFAKKIIFEEDCIFNIIILLKVIVFEWICFLEYTFFFDKNIFVHN